MHNMLIPVITPSTISGFISYSSDQYIECRHNFESDHFQNNPGVPELTKSQDFRWTKQTINPKLSITTKQMNSSQSTGRYHFLSLFPDFYLLSQLALYFQSFCEQKNILP